MTIALRPVDVPEPVVSLVATLEAAGHEAWCVGGALRDAVLQLAHADFDVATSATPDQVRRLFRRTVPVGEAHGTIGVLDDAGTLHEVTTFRRDVRTDGRHAEVAFGVSLDDDLARRDFTINALAYHPLRQVWRDPFGGARDIGERQLRAVGDPASRFREDYLRILRGLRFAARFSFTITPETWTALTGSVAGLAQLSSERVRDEWFKGLRTAAVVSEFVMLWLRSGAAAIILPELEPDRGAEPVLSGMPRDPVLLTTVLTDASSSVLSRLRASNAEVARAAAISAGPLAPAGPSDRDVRRWLSAAGTAADDLAQRHLFLTGRDAPWADAVQRIRTAGDPLFRENLAVRGGDLLELGLRGPAVGQALDRLLSNVLDDPSLNERDTLLRLARTPQ
jgi:tRNA nucleotidyltransferase (CCA-adding enzyme)